MDLLGGPAAGWTAYETEGYIQTIVRQELHPAAPGNRPPAVRSAHLRASLPLHGRVRQASGPAPRRPAHPARLLPRPAPDPRALRLRSGQALRGAVARLPPPRQDRQGLEAQDHPSGVAAATHLLCRAARATRTGRSSPRSAPRTTTSLPAVLTRQQVHDLLAHIRLRRYRTPLKLIYCCGLRLSECLGLTIHDILRQGEQALGPPRQGRQGPHGAAARAPWSRTCAATGASTAIRLLLFPNVGRGHQ